jgi:GntR family transcriptional repressor for pyruvate dehydrogenase complex
MKELFDFHPQRDRLYEQVADRIQLLNSGDSLRPGDRLSGERELAERMGVSRTIVREAVRVLNDRGPMKAGCGTYVQELCSRDAASHIELFLKLRQAPKPFQDIHEICRVIEVEPA